jgi:hypothetical protein
MEFPYYFKTTITKRWVVLFSRTEYIEVGEDNIAKHEMAVVDSHWYMILNGRSACHVLDAVSLKPITREEFLSAYKATSERINNYITNTIINDEKHFHHFKRHNIPRRNS